MPPIELVAVLGSVTPPGRLRLAVADALRRAETGLEISTRLIDLAAVRIAFADGRPPEELGDDTATVVDQLAGADAVLLATPVYRGSLTGALKNLLDHVPVAALQDTPVAIVAMGARPEHFLGAERHLRDVLAFFGALCTPVATYLVSDDFTDGRPTEAAQARLDVALSGLVTLTQALCSRTAPLGAAPLAAARRASG